MKRIFISHWMNFNYVEQIIIDEVTPLYAINLDG
jgi:hypothetical protein